MNHHELNKIAWSAGFPPGQTETRDHVTAFSPYSAYPSPESQLPFQSAPLPVLTAVADRAPQRRLTVFFRLIMLIPHWIVLFFLVIAAEVVAFIGWWGALFTGRLPEFAHTFLSGVLRWSARVYGYGLLLTDVYPPFSLDDEPGYPVRVAVPPAQTLNRAAVFFRFILLIPVGIMSSFLTFGAATLMAIIAWLITLVAGQLPASFHCAYSAVLRFQSRYYGYAAMLTPAYPGRLFGDAPGTPAWAEAYGYPAQRGYSYGHEYGAQPSPASWQLLLPAAAKRLLVVFIVLGAIFYAGFAVADQHFLSSFKSQDNVATAQQALNQVEGSYATLTKNLTSWQSAVQQCDGNLTCVTGQDAKAAGYFTTFGNRLAATVMPPNSVAAAARLGRVSSMSGQDFTQLSKVTSAAQYQAVVNSTDLQTTLNDFDSDYNALVNALESNLRLARRDGPRSSISAAAPSSTPAATSWWARSGASF